LERQGSWSLLVTRVPKAGQVGTVSSESCPSHSKKAKAVLIYKKPQKNLRMTTPDLNKGRSTAGAGLKVVVTGGATGIGRAITEAFVEIGARVVVGQPDVAVAQALLERHGPSVRVLPVDIGEPAACKGFMDEGVEWLGGLDVLVNNAAMTGVSCLGSLAEVTPAGFDRMMRVNVGGAFFCSQAAVPHLRANGGGVIVHISSVNAIRPQRGAMVYAASKAALSSLAQSMAKELAGDGIRVVAVAPGDIRVETSWEMEQQAAEGGAGADVVGQTPLGHGEPNDVAQAVVFICSPGARFVTGVTWVVDGGLLA